MNTMKKLIYILTKDAFRGMIHISKIFDVR